MVTSGRCPTTLSRPRANTSTVRSPMATSASVVSGAPGARLPEPALPPRISLPPDPMSSEKSAMDGMSLSPSGGTWHLLVVLGCVDGGLRGHGVRCFDDAHRWRADL